MTEPARKALMIDTMFLRRPVLNGFDLIEWAQSQGLRSMLDLDTLHVTLAFSRAPVDVKLLDDTEDVVIVPEGGTRSFEALGDKGAAVLRFESDVLTDRWQDVLDAGGSWDHDGFKPHVTITWDIGDIDPDDVEPYTGRLVFGQEKLSNINDDFLDEITETEIMDENFEITTDVVKVDEGLGLVMGFAIICKQNGERYFDLQKQHIPEATMLQASLDFMENSQVAKEMHQGGKVGSVVFAFPLTTEIAKAFLITTATTGLMIAMRPSDPGMLKRFKTGELTGFSIGGECVVTPENPNV